MATPKPQPSRALKVIPSPLCNIPNPALLITNATVILISEQNKIKLDDLPNTLNELGVKAGDIVYAPGLGAATITQITGPFEFNTNAPNDPMAPPVIVNDPCSIYNGEDNSDGCILYIGTGGGGLITITAGGDEAIYSNVLSGQIIPVQTKAVTGSIEGTDNIIALW